MKIVFWILSFVLLVLLNSNIAWGKIDCNIHKAYCTIIKLNPKISRDFAMQLSNEIYKKSREYKVDIYRVIAIMRQESGISMNARNKSIKENSHTECDEWEKCVTTTITTIETTDFGLFQFHKRTMINNNLNIAQIMNDMPFVVNFATNMIANKIKMCSKKWPKTPWACYNSANETKHQEYVKLVNRYYLGNKLSN